MNDVVESFAGRVRDAALTTPGVADLSAGVLGEVATYLPGDRVPGVRFGEDGVHVHLVLTAAGATDVPGVAGAAHAAVQGVLADAAGPGEEGSPGPGTPVHVHVDDVDVARVAPGDEEVPATGTRKDES